MLQQNKPTLSRDDLLHAAAQEHRLKACPQCGGDLETGSPQQTPTCLGRGEWVQDYNCVLCDITWRLVLVNEHVHRDGGYQYGHRLHLQVFRNSGSEAARLPECEVDLHEGMHRFNSQLNEPCPEYAYRQARNKSV
jgi:hypothetical protein